MEINLHIEWSHGRLPFISVEPLMRDLDANFLLFNVKRGIHFRSGTIEVAMKRRWKEHVSSNMRTHHVNRSNKLYKLYPHINCKDITFPSQGYIMGNY